MYAIRSYYGPQGMAAGMSSDADASRLVVSGQIIDAVGLLQHPVITSYSIHYTKLYDAAGILEAIAALDLHDAPKGV